MNSIRTPQDVISDIKENNVKWIRLQFCNVWGTLHQFSVPSMEVDTDSFSKGFSLDGSSISGFQEVDNSDMYMIPDPDTFTILPKYFDQDHQNKDQQFSTKSASMFVKLYQGNHGKRFPRDSRYVAEKADNIAKDAGFDAICAAEVEFWIFDKMRLDISAGSAVSPYVIHSRETASSNLDRFEETIPNKGGYYIAPPNDHLSNFRDEVAETLMGFGIRVSAQHHEVGAAGQCEVILKYGSALSSSDEIMIAHKTIREIAAKRGMVASFIPKPFENDNRSAQHMNHSLWQTKNGQKINAFFDPEDKYAELSQTGYYYVGGILEHAKSLCFITNPSENSYKGLVPGFEAPVYIAWSTGNRSSAIRIPAHRRNMNKLKRVEFRVPDPSSNIYLANTAILLAGLDGIKKKIQPPSPVDKIIYNLSEMERRALGISKLPSSLDAAREELRADNEYLQGAMDTAMLDAMFETKNTKELFPVVSS
ncbi:MAG: type I glutamate--ammonia ligase [Nitrosopumilus sp.]|nr:type I glutamate--ammonia ligase [Nitrosopumilus sp.]